MNVLLTGHNGYIGSVMVSVLQAAGHHVTGLDTYFFEECTFIPDEHFMPSLRKDIRDLTLKDVQGFEAIVHLAALSNDPLSDFNPALTYEINHEASVHLAKLAKEAGVQRFLFASSCSVYGKANSEKLLTENDTPYPLTPYAVSKARAEKDITKLADASFSPVFLRNATTYGVSPRLRVDLVVNNLVGWAYTTGKIQILKEVTMWRPMAHIEDISRAFAAILAAPQEVIHNQIFNVGVNGENYQICDLVEIVRESVPGCKVEYAIKKGSDLRSYRVDFSKLARTLPNLKLKWCVPLGVKQLYDIFKQIGLGLEEFQSRKYIRLAQLNHLIKSGNLDNTMRWEKSLIYENKDRN